MQPRDLYAVLIRVLGLWLICAALGTLSDTFVHIAWVIFTPGESLAHYVSLLVSGAAAVARFVIGGLLILAAPRIANWSFPESRELPEDDRPRWLHIGDLYRIACIMLGGFAWLQAIRPGSQLLVAMFGLNTGNGASFLIAQAVEFFAFAVLGTVLVFGAANIARGLGRLRYDPHRVPSPQFGLRELLLVMIGVCVLLAAIRYLVLNMTW